MKSAYPTRHSRNQDRNPKAGFARNPNVVASFVVNFVDPGNDKARDKDTRKTVYPVRKGSKIHSGGYVGLVLLVVAALLVRPAGAGTTNTVPWAESFESYGNGVSIVGTNGWSCEATNAALATTDANVAALLAAYTNVVPATRSYPLPATNHTAALQATVVVTNDVVGANGGVVALDVMVWPTVGPTEDPPAPTNLHYALYVNASSNLVIWHQNRSNGQTNNVWSALTNGPAIAFTNWSRLTVIQDYGHRMFQIRVNQDTNAVSDPAGWSVPGNGAAPTGSWFHMVKTNAWMSHVMLGGDDTNYVDDVVLARRSVTWSTNAFAEDGVLNDGTIDASTLFAIGVTYDTFAGTNGQVLDATAVTVTNLPAGLTGVVTRVDDTHLRLALAGQAVPNEAADGVSNITVTLQDNAFTLGNAADVTGRSNGTIAVTFLNSAGVGTLTASGTHFGEAAANDGSISNSLTLTLTVATFTNVSPLRPDVDYTVTNVPPGLQFVLDRHDATTAVARLANNATTHTFGASLTNLDLTFLNAAFPGMTASNVLGSALSLAVDFRDPPVLGYSGTNFSEAAANDGTVTNAITITLSGDTFSNTTFTSGVQYEAPGLPVNLALSLVRSNAATVTATLTGSAAAHAASNSLASIGFAFLNPAFDTVGASNIVGRATNIALSFRDPPVVSVGGTNFVEVAANNGSMGNSNIITLVGGAFASGPFVTNTHYTVANVPAGLTFSLTRDSDSQLTASLSGRADNHRATNSIGNLTLTFLDDAFSAVQAARVIGHPFTFAVAFSNPPSLGYSRGGFTETSGGQVDNRVPLTITLSNDTFAADVAGRVGVGNLPEGLESSFTRDSDTQVSVRLTGAATSHASGDSRINLTFTFQAGAFAMTDNDQVEGYVRTNLTVTFVDDVGFFNVVPYGEPFEDYASGSALAGTNGWTADYYADAGVVIDDAAVTSNEMRYVRTHPTFPILTNHLQVVSVQDSLRVAVHSESNQPLVYLDLMLQPVAMQETPDSNTNVQYALYVSTNRQVVIWHCNRTTEPPTNEWLTLAQGPLIDTSRWSRFTVAQDYATHRFQVRINEHDPIVDAAGWTDGGAPTGSWFYMVQTNATMSHVILDGTGQAYLDDVTVRTNLPASFGGSLGNVFTFR